MEKEIKKLELMIKEYYNKKYILEQTKKIDELIIERINR